MVTLTRKCGSVFLTSLSVFYEDRNKECAMKEAGKQATN